MIEAGLPFSGLNILKLSITIIVFEFELGYIIIAIALIKEYLLVDIEERHKGNWDTVVKKQFLNARSVNFSKVSVICPVWDLVNHNVNAFPFLRRFNGIGTPNYSPRKSELTFNYGLQSSIGRVFNYGFFSRESIVFSFPFKMTIKDRYHQRGHS